MKKLYWGLMLMAVSVCFTACNSEKDDDQTPTLFDVSQIIGSWNVIDYSYVVKNWDEDTVMVSDVRQNPGEITIRTEQNQILYTENFTDAELGRDRDGDVILHEKTFDLSCNALDYPHLLDLSVKDKGNTIEWVSAFNGTAEETRKHSGEPDEHIKYNTLTEVKISVTKK